MAEVIVPDIGDFSDVEVIDIYVKPGDKVAVEAPLITVETDKASMDIPSSMAGTVSSLAVKVGSKINQGDVIAVLNTDEVGTTETAPQSTPAPQPAAAATPPPVAPQTAPDNGAQPATQILKVPDIGDFTDAEIIEVHIAPGQQINKEDSLVTLETDKASMDVPASVGGTVNKVLITQGNKVSEGAPIAEILVRPDAPTPVATPEPASAPSPAPAPVPSASPAPSTSPTPAPAPASAGGDASTGVIHATPVVRKLAREYGVNLSKVTGSGRHRRILKEDIQQYVKQQLAADTGSGSMLNGYTYQLPTLAEENYAQFGQVEQVSLSRVKKISGPALHRNWIAVPLVTQFDEADVTDLENFRKMNSDSAKARGFSLSPLAFLIKAVASTLNEHPEFNASLALDGKSVYLKKYYNIGIAVDTAGGLLVPVIKDAQHRSVMQIAQELAELSSRARSGKAGPKDLSGGTFTISSLGGIGGSHFTPIVNVPEVAILGVGKSKQQPSWDGEKFVPRLMMPLALSYDHRVIDGAMGARFITHLCSLLGDLRRLAL